MRNTRVGLICLLAAGGITSLEAQQDYVASTAPTGSWTAGAYAGFGALAGQTFTASGATLNAFGFFASAAWTGNRTFHAALYAFNGSAIMGSALYSSSVLNYSTVTTGWFDFFTGGIGLAPGSVYMALLIPEWASTGLATINLGVEAGDPYAGSAGMYAYRALPVTDPALQGAAWNAVGGPIAPGTDLALRLDYARPQVIPQDEGPSEEVPVDEGPSDEGPFDDGPFDEGPAEDGPTADDDFPDVAPTTTAPEPASIVLVATGLIGLIGAGRVRQKRQG